MDATSSATLGSYALVALASGTILVPILAQLIKKLAGLQAEAVIHTMVVALAVVTEAAQYFMQVHGKLPVVVPGLSAVAIYGASQFAYRYLGYAKTLLGQVSISIAKPAAETVAADAAVAAVAVPADAATDQSTETPADPAATGFNG